MPLNEEYEIIIEALEDYLANAEGDEDTQRIQEVLDKYLQLLG